VEVNYNNLNSFNSVHQNENDIHHDNDDGNESNHDETIQKEYEDFDNEIKTDVCNRKNQWYDFYILGIIF